MSTSSTLDTIRAWAGMNRPLRELTKAQLWKYPQANNTPEGEWDFSKEVLARVMAYRAKEAELAKAERNWQQAKVRASGAHANIARHSDKVPQDPALLEHHTATTAMLKRAAANADAAIPAAEKQMEQFKVELAESTRLDSIISPLEVQDYYSTRYGPRWTAIIERWKAGDLFNAQRHGWGSFICCSDEDHAADCAAYKEAEQTAKLTYKNESVDFKAMKVLYDLRVLPALTERRAFLAEGKADGPVIIASLKPEQQARYWAWEKAYTAAGKANGWMDDSQA